MMGRESWWKLLRFWSGIAGTTSGNAAVLIVAAGLTAADARADPVDPTAPNWNGYYVGGYIGQAWGRTDWSASEGSASVANGSFGLYNAFDAFNETGSWFEGIEVGHNHMLGRQTMLGVEADMMAPAYPNSNGISIGGSSAFSPSGSGNATYSESTLWAGSLRGRVGYALSNWLLYGTGGFAWTYNQTTLSTDTGDSERRAVWRPGWTVGGGVEVPLIPSWTGKVEYLFTDFSGSSANFSSVGERFDASSTVQQVRLGLNYQFGDYPETSKEHLPAQPIFGADWFAIHGQTTYVEQAHPGFHSLFVGPNSMPGAPDAEETWDLTLFVGARLWHGAELWFNPEIDQGFGFANTHGAAGFPSAEAYKLGFDQPYARIQRLFLRQTIDLGGESQKIDADTNQFSATQTADRLVLTFGRFSVADLFDTNSYANSPKTDFLNWSLINAGTFDYAGDGWGYTYGAAAEWYWDRWTLRGGIFDLSVTPAGGTSPFGGDLDPNFSQLQYVAELEERHKLWDQPGKLKITGFVSNGRAGRFADAIALSEATGQPADINAVRDGDTARPGISVNLEQQINDSVGAFARAGWADGNIEPWDFTDIDRTLSGGVQVIGKQWGRPDDKFGLGGAINDISGVHKAFLNAGGLGILVGDGQLPHPALEKILETYYSYALCGSTKLTADYQFISDPAYNSDRGPISVFSGRLHSQF
ncbi:carbohydrate porin [Hyphomicrobium sp. ghe19]|uniref:carbohydrate porin n=1 Tax=Hyphomicrobium sp. ghe19 TaxID=2682968 RepID=UPI001366DF7E|nr:hypothetical protein HYPP_04038 [Hyphomicrobium sp. ghe19]